MMESTRWTGLAIGALLLCGSGMSGAAESVAVRDAWVRAPVPGQNIAAAYLELTADAKSALVAIATPVAARSELHSTTMSGGVMKMRPAERIELVPGRPVKLEPGGFHAMLIDLKRTLKPGDKVPLTLTIERADASRTTIAVRAEVRSADGMAMQHH